MTVFDMAKARKVLSVLIAAVLLLSAGGCTNLANVLEENTDLGEQSPTPSASPSVPVEPEMCIRDRFSGQGAIPVMPCF